VDPFITYTRKVSCIVLLIALTYGCANVKTSYIDSRWKVQSFVFPKDKLSCEGKQLIQYSPKYDVFVGLVLCNDDEQFRLYMSDSFNGAYFPVTDTGGHGQDHCELVNDDFRLPDSDDIKSGGCTTCSTSRNLPLENVVTWSRSGIGMPFQLLKSGVWSYQTSRLQCGVLFTNCASTSRKSYTQACHAVMK